MEIIVRSNDADFDLLSQRFDPLTFAIAEAPRHGFFVAPLLPYFVEDFRLPFSAMIDRCTPNRPPEVVVDPQYVTVTDDGLTYVLNAPVDLQAGSVCSSRCDPDEFFFCLRQNRISVFDAEGNFLVGRDLPKSNDLFGLSVDVARGRIVYSIFNIIMTLDLHTLETLATYDVSAFRNANVNKAVIDKNNIMYMATGVTAGRIVVFDLRNVPLDANGVGVVTEQLGEFVLEPSQEICNVCPTLDMALDSTEALYTNTFFRVYKFSPTTFDDAGNAVLGGLIGWSGACNGGAACDTINQRSRGYSCTDAACSANLQPPPTGQRRDGAGQFDRLAGIAIDPNDILYVSDRFNDRVQRFTPDGFYAGQARSACPSTQRCFVLGDFGRPTTVAVNSNHFYLLDETLNIVHVFQTSPLTPIDDTSARMTY